MPRTRLTRAVATVALIAGLTAAPAEAAATSAPAARAITAVTDAHAATTGTSVPTLGRQYAFSTVLDGKPVRWNPCSAIHWRANVTRAPLGGLDVLKAAVASIAAATGTTWVYDGTSTAIPSTTALPTTATQARPVLIGWTDGTASNLLRGQPASVLGMTRTSWFGTATAAGAIAATRGAVVALDRTDRLPLRGPVSWSAVALHELGHVMGLAHAADGRMLMAATMPATTSALQTGDRAGLTRLGRTQGCVVVPAS